MSDDIEDPALDALIVLALRQDNLDSLPELTEEELKALDSIDYNFVEKLFEKERKE